MPNGWDNEGRGVPVRRATSVLATESVPVLLPSIALSSAQFVDIIGVGPAKSKKHATAATVRADFGD